MVNGRILLKRNLHKGSLERTLRMLLILLGSVQSKCLSPKLSQKGTQHSGLLESSVTLSNSPLHVGYADKCELLTSGLSNQAFENLRNLSRSTCSPTMEITR